MRLSKSRMLSLWWFTYQISNSTCGRALSCFGIGWQILQIDFLWSTSAFPDSGVGLGNFWKNRVRVRRLKIYLFIFSINFKGKNIFLFWESMQTTSFESMQKNIRSGKAFKKQMITNIFHCWESMQTTSFSIYFLYVILFIANIISEARKGIQVTLSVYGIEASA